MEVRSTTVGSRLHTWARLIIMAALVLLDHCKIVDLAARLAEALPILLHLPILHVGEVTELHFLRSIRPLPAIALLVQSRRAHLMLEVLSGAKRQGDEPRAERPLLRVERALTPLHEALPPARVAPATPDREISDHRSLAFGSPGQGKPDRTFTLTRYVPFKGMEGTAPPQETRMVSATPSQLR